ncbi:hypothetical protein DPMN_145682 [Dreissena polymorpha]|uniref:Uncharacterized protein n=1 Tax=Dreissena polymorpha TaxID=45954 RepID=A0A9D4F8X4_DREPO|nr:hypothetical protein DPMN_145682 [Dreissena polymorpha]
MHLSEECLISGRIAWTSPLPEPDIAIIFRTLMGDTVTSPNRLGHRHNRGGGVLPT